MATIETSPTVPTVYVRRVLNGPWTLDAHLRASRVQFALAPARCTAELVRYYGLIDTIPDGAGPALVAPADYSGYQIKIVLTRGTAAPVYFYGLITAQQDHPGAPYASDYPVAAGQSQPNGRTVYHVEGWETLLHRYSLQHAYLAGKSGSNFTAPALIATPVVFNARTRQGTLKGNRSATRNTDLGCYLFSDAADAGTWDAAQALEYLLALFYARHGWRFTLADPAGAPAGYQDQSAALQGYKDVWDLAGQSYADAICRLVNPARGFTWFCQGDTPALTVLTCVDESVELDGAILAPENYRLFYPDLDSAPLANDPQISPLEDVYFHQVEAIADPLRVCFTVGYGGSRPYPGLVEHWLPALETEYDALADDEAAQASKYDHVYQAFRFVSDWNGQTKNGAADVPVLCQINDDTCKVDPATVVENWHRASLLLDRTLPLLQEEEAADTGSERPPLILCLNAEGKYYRIDRPLIDDGIDPVSVRVLADDLGFAIAAKFPHQYGGTAFGGTFSDFDVQADYRDLIATVSLRTQERARALVSTVRPLLDSEELAVKELSLPGLGLSYIVAGTVTDFNATTLTTSAGEYTRDDSALIRAIANLAANWYGRRRYQVRAQYYAALLMADDDGVPYLGFTVADLVWHGESVRPRTVVSRILYTFDGDRQTVAWESDFADYDWRSLYQGNAASHERQRLDALEDATRRAPVLVAAAGAGAASAYDGPWAVSQDPAAANKVIVGANRAATRPDLVICHPDNVSVTSASAAVTVTANGVIYVAVTKEGTIAAAAPAFATSLPAHTATVENVPLAYVTFADGAVTAIWQCQYGHIVRVQTILAACP